MALGNTISYDFVLAGLCFGLLPAVLGLELCLSLGFVSFAVVWVILGQLLSTCVWRDIVVCVLDCITPDVFPCLVMACGFGFELWAGGPLY